MKLVGFLLLMAALAAPSASFANDWRHWYGREHYSYGYYYPRYYYGSYYPRYHYRRHDDYRHHQKYYHHRPYTCGHYYGR
ncbi:MAG: hypothetical protein HY694_14770 [Deltaproteobacteria bacterium]|nr:hypothetical protein [Deltaproteobacteria bacterium]